MEGWIKLHRKLLDWEWWDDNNVFKLWIYILLSANHTSQKWRGTLIKSGSFITSFSKMSEKTRLSEGKIRTALKKLEKSGNISRIATNKYQTITIENWRLYQGEDEKAYCQISNKLRADDNEVTTNNNEENENSLKNEKKESARKGQFGRFNNVLLTDEEYQKLLGEYENADEAITFLDEYIEMKGYRAKSHYLAILKWVFDALAERKAKSASGSGNVFLNMLGGTSNGNI